MIRWANLILDDVKFPNDDEEYDYGKLKLTVAFGDYAEYIHSGKIIENNSSGNIIIPKEYSEKSFFKINDTIEISGKKFKISGIGDFSLENNFIISYKDFKDMKLNTKKIIAYATDEINYEKIKEFQNELGKALDVEFSGLKHPKNKFSSKIMDFVLFSVVFGLCMLNMIFVYRYTLFKKAKLINIFRLSGIKSQSLYLSEFISIGITFVISFVGAIIFSEIFNKVFLENILNSKIYLMQLIHYALVFSVYFIIYLIFMIFVFSKHFMGAIVKNIKEQRL